MKPSLNTLPATELAAQATAGAITCEQVVRECLDRVAAREPVIKAWAYIDPDLVLRQAKAIDARANRGPLHGVPIGIKDVIETADMPTQMGSSIYRGYQTLSDASCVAVLRAAGALIFGKTVTCEFAGPAANVTTNPHDPTRTPGGSSSGSGAAVADYMVPFGFGTQTGGSVQRPSSYCGIVGFKPSFGLINPQGVKPAAESLDTVGLMVRTVEDAELFMRVLTGSEPVRWLSGDTRIRVGLCRTYAWDGAEEATRQAVEDAARRLEKAGFTVRDVELPSPCETLPTTREIINDFERARGMAWEWNTHRDQISAALAKAIRNGLTIPRAQYIEALETVERCRQRTAQLFNDVDVLLTPTVNGEAPVGLANTGDHRFQSIWTQLRTPAVTLPTHAGPNGMPVGIQLIGPRYGDDRLLAIAQRVFALLGRGPMIKL
ncbi:amidase [Pseudolabrys taiwanensis]|nr:amidase [Pseudolabrys taiwanensis]